MKKFIALLLSLAMVLSLCSLTACGKRGSEGDTNKDGDTADAKYTLTIGHVYTEDSIEHKQMAKIKELVEEKTNGACRICPSGRPDRRFCKAGHLHCLRHIGRCAAS